MEFGWVLLDAAGLWLIPAGPLDRLFGTKYGPVYLKKNPRPRVQLLARPGEPPSRRCFLARCARFQNRIRARGGLTRLEVGVPYCSPRRPLTTHGGIALVMESEITHTITSRPLEKTALRRGPSPVPVRKGGPAYGRSENHRGFERTMEKSIRTIWISSSPLAVQTFWLSGATEVVETRSFHLCGLSDFVNVKQLILYFKHWKHSQNREHCLHTNIVAPFSQ